MSTSNSGRDGLSLYLLGFHQIGRWIGAFAIAFLGVALYGGIAIAFVLIETSTAPMYLTLTWVAVSFGIAVGLEKEIREEDGLSNPIGDVITWVDLGIVLLVVGVLISSYLLGPAIAIHILSPDGVTWVAMTLALLWPAAEISVFDEFGISPLAIPAILIILTLIVIGLLSRNHLAEVPIFRRNPLLRA